MRTVRIHGVACGIIADMWRLIVGLAAWIAGTAIAVSVAWLGANVVVRNAGVGPGMPVINAAVLPSATASASASPTAPSGPSTPTATVTVTPPRRAATSRPASPPVSTGRPAASARVSTSFSGSPSGEVHAYALTGGTVTLELTGDSAQLVTAVPAAGYSVQTWSGTDWLRVDFSSGPLVSSLIASWYEHAPTVTVEN
jgi:hypothetical protein